MKRIIFLISVVIFFCSWAGHAQIASDTVGCVPMLIKFKSPTGNLSAPIWDFGDGASSNILNPQHIYVNNGVFNVRLTNEDTLVISFNVTIYPEVIPIISSDITEGCAPSTVKFNNATILPSGINLSSVLWDFGDGVGSNDIQPSHTYEDIGIYDVVLTVQTQIESCTNTQVFSNYIKISDKQNAGFKLDSLSHDCDVPILAYFSYIGDTGSGYTFEWDFGNGMARSQQIPGPIQYDEVGKYRVSLKVDNNKNCISTINEIFDINYLPKIDLDITKEICVDDVISFNNNSVAQSYFWQFGDNASILTSTMRVPANVSFNAVGEQEIKLTMISEQGCSLDTSFFVLVKQADASFVVEPQIVCNPPVEVQLIANDNSAKRYLWNGEVGSFTKNIKIEYPDRDTFYYHERDSVVIILNIIDENGCSGEFESYYIVQPVNAQFEVSAHEGETPFLLWVYDRSEADCPIVKWIYDWGDGTTSEYNPSNIGSARHLYENAGEYYVNLSIEDEKGCIDEHYGAWIEVKDPLVFTMNEPTCIGGSSGGVICYGDTFGIAVLFIPEGVDAIHVTLGNTLGHCEKDSIIRAVALDDPFKALQSVINLENGGVFYDFNGPIFTYRGAKAVIDYQTSCDDKYKVFFQNNSINAQNHRWIIESKEFYQDQFFYDFPGRGDYEVLLIAENDMDGCQPDTARVTISLRDVKAIITANDDMCPDVTNVLFSRNSEDEVAGCKMGYLWSFPKSLEIPHIITDVDSVLVKLPSGVHRIFLEVRDVNGCRDTTYKDINVVSIQANFVSDRERICDPTWVTFTDSSISDNPIVDFKWNLLPDININTITYLFDSLYNVDNIFVGLTIKDSLGCVSSIVKSFEVYKPVTQLTYNNVVCFSNKGVIEASDFNENGSFLNYNWQINGQNVQADSILDLVDLPVGLHNIKLRIEENSTKCFNNYDFLVRVVEDPRAIIGDIDSVFCFPKTLFLMGDDSYSHPSDPVTYKWNFGNNRQSIRSNPVVTFGKGSFNIQLTLTSELGCISIDEKTVHLVGPDGLLLADKDVVCVGEDIVFELINPEDVTSFYWDFGQGQTQSNTSPVAYKYDFLPPSSTTFASLVLSSSDTGCETVLIHPIEIANVKAFFESSTTCEDTLRVLNLSTGADRFTWLSNQIFAENVFSPLIRVDKAGMFPLTLIIENSEFGCKDTMTQEMVFLQRPEFELPTQVSICSDQKITLPLAPQYSYEISPAGWARVNNGQITFTANTSAILQVQGTSENGCTTTQRVAVLHSGFLVDVMTEDWLVCDNQRDLAINFDIFEGDSMVWWLNNRPITSGTLSCENCTNPVIESNIEGLLSLNIFNYSTCLNRSFHYNIENLEIELPNIFSPNGDNINDIFRPVLAQNTPYEEELVIKNLTIINRWGKEVYNSNLPWDGNIDGHPAAAEVYYFSIEYGVGQTCVNRVKGDVTLMR